MAQDDGCRDGRTDTPTSQADFEPTQVDPRPHWIPFVVIIGLALPFLVLMVLGAILFT